MKHYLIIDGDGYNVAVIPEKNFKFEFERALKEHYILPKVSIQTLPTEDTSGDATLLSSDGGEVFTDTFSIEAITVY